MSAKRIRSIVDDYHRLTGDLSIPDTCYGLVIFVHGSGSSRLSPRNQRVAEILNERGIATFLFDLLTPEEDRTYSNRFNIDLLVRRLQHATAKVLDRREFKHLSIGFFGASTGAAAALRGAAEIDPEFRDALRAVVSRGGRPDLAGDALAKVDAATLLIVGGDNVDVLELNREAFRKMHCERELQIVPEAGHLFEEPGKLQIVADLAASWFLKHFVPIGTKVVTQPDESEEEISSRASLK